MTLIDTGSFKDTKNIETLILEAFVAILSTCRFQVIWNCCCNPHTQKFEEFDDFDLFTINTQWFYLKWLFEETKSQFLCLPYTNIQVVKG